MRTMTDQTPNARASDAAGKDSPEGAALSRRGFLGRALALGAAGLGAPALLAACGGGENGAAGNGAAQGGSAAGGEADVVAAECAGFDQLTDQEMQMRQTLGYVDVTPDPDKLCTNCQFYETTYEGGGADSPCGGCLLFAGPVAPDGYCNSWAAMA